MKNLLFCLLVSMTILACNQQQASDPSIKRDEAIALYEKNLTVVKSVVSAFEQEQIEALAATIADSAVWTIAAYGSVPGTKEDWIKALSAYLTDWDSLRLQDPIFLPGLNSKTYEIDGSVRYYGQWLGVHKSGVKTTLNFYGTYEFNTDNKIVNGAEFYDLGGLMNAVKPK